MKQIDRRTALTTLAAGLPLTALATAAAAKDAAGTAAKLRVVVTGGHPGDPEYGCGGTIARYTDLGHNVLLLYLNEGEPPDQPRSHPHGFRVAEANKACEHLRARPAFAGQIDGRAIVDEPHYDAFHKLLQAEQPDVVFTHWPIDNHADHRAMSLLVYEAWLRMGRKFALYYYEVSDGEDTVQFAPTHYVNIAATVQVKRQACYAHASQAPDKFYPLQELVTRLRGLESGHPQAEGFIRHVQSQDFGLPGIA